MDEISGSGSRLTFGGLATGLDTGAIIEALLNAERRPVTLLENRRENLESQQTLLQTLSGQVLELRNAARAIDNRTSLFSGASFDEEFLTYKATSSDSDRLEVEVNGNAAPGSFEVEINQLATVGRDISARYTGTDAVLDKKRDRDFSIDFGGADPISFNIPKGTTLAELRDLIELDENNDGSITASLLDDGTGTRLVITGNETGAVNDLVVTTDLRGPGNTNFIEQSQDGEDAQLTYLGVSVTRASNDIADLVPGVSLRLRGETELNTPIQVTLSRNDEDIEASLQAFADAYNSVQGFMNDQAEINPATNRGGVLIGDSMLRRIESNIRNEVIAAYDFGAENPFSSVSQIGLELQADGTLALDAEKLRAALDQDAGSVRELLSGQGEGEGKERVDGVATALARALDDIVKPGNVFFETRDESVETRIDGLDRQILRLESRLVDREEFLIRQFSQLESLISTIRAQSGFLGGE